MVVATNLGLAASPTRSAAVDRVPLPKRTGNDLIDGQKTSERMMLQDIIDTCIADSTHIMPMFLHLQKRLRSGGTVQADGQHFNRDTTTVGKIPEEFMINLMSQLGDIPVDRIVRCKTVDDEGPKQLKHFCFQLNENLKVPTSFLAKEVAKRALRSRCVDLGNRLVAFRTAGGLQADGTLDSRRGCYKVDFADGALASITHISGDRAALTDNVKRCVTISAKLCENWSDERAHLAIDGMPAIILMKLFPRGTGPHRVASFGCRAKAFADFVAPLDQAYQTEVQAVRSNSGQAEQAAADCLKEVQKQKRKEVFLNAREKALETLKAKKAKRTIAFDG